MYQIVWSFLAFMPSLTPRNSSRIFTHLQKQGTPFLKSPLVLYPFSSEYYTREMIVFHPTFILHSPFPLSCSPQTILQSFSIQIYYSILPTSINQSNPPKIPAAIFRPFRPPNPLTPKYPQYNILSNHNYLAIINPPSKSHYKLP